jgi:hypothetical protein
MADMLRGQSAEAPQTRMMGRVAVAPSIANVAANIYSGYKGGQMERSAQQGLQGLADKRSDILKQYFGSMTKKQPGEMPTE